MNEDELQTIASHRNAFPHITPLITDWRAHEDQGGDAFHAVKETAAILTATDQLIPLRYKHADATDPKVIAWVDEVVTNAERARVSGGAKGGPGPSLLLLGPTGTGKTHQGYGALRRLSVIGVNTAAAAAPIADIYAKMRPRPGVDSETVFESYAQAPLLFVDDLGAAKESEWVEEVTTRLVNYRYDRSMPTIFTSNVPPKQLGEKIGERVASRLTELCRVVVLKGTDRRLAGRAA
ncbi:ATP-binding protein [Nocardiopsis lucentensis]|uniref:ATP-binding protein n=1 Tax=Nocardiopsis lucentensis TaxID=53441 RepID=UPI00036A46FD|nr:ATP-binding protein [Nocardiopsis lucentensis]